jgi:peptidoglycan/xylan/chitin deacetylase (PgdA/CDA1 family)
MIIEPGRRRPVRPAPPCDRGVRDRRKVDLGGACRSGAATNGAAVQRFEAGDAVTSRAVSAKTIALTFDDGPDQVWTPRIVAVLASTTPTPHSSRWAPCHCSKSSTAS